jgi:hypothetical protein
VGLVYIIRVDDLVGHRNISILVDNTGPILRDFKIPFDRVTHISFSIANINIYKYRANLVDLKTLRNICKWDLVLIILSHRT